MKRFLALLIILVISCSMIMSAFAEDAPVVYSYDFDLKFHMNADVFPARIRSHMQGYADLLNLLELKGNLTYCPETNSVDLNARIIPVTNPDAAISFRLYGIPEHLGMTSPLLGNESIWFQNYVLMEFAYKTWNNLRIPLQYVTLLYPYVTRSAFENMTAAWNRFFSPAEGSRVISAKDLNALAEEWTAVLRSDSRLKYWIYSLSLPVNQGNVMEDELFHIPDYLVNQVALGGDLRISADSHSVTCTNTALDLLYSHTSGDDCEEWMLSLPPTGNGYVPDIVCRFSEEGNTYSLSLNGSYSIPAGQPVDSSSLPDSLFSVALEMNRWPSVWPMDSSFTASLGIGGIIYPNMDLTVQGSGSADGKLKLVFSRPVGQDGTTEILTCSGTIVPVASVSIPRFTPDDFKSHLAIFNVNDMTMEDFVHRVRRPLFFGILNFLNELPASACQSVMDDLEDYGVLDMVLVD